MQAHCGSCDVYYWVRILRWKIYCICSFCIVENRDNPRHAFFQGEFCGFSSAGKNGRDNENKYRECIIFDHRCRHTWTEKYIMLLLQRGRPAAQASAGMNQNESCVCVPLTNWAIHHHLQDYLSHNIGLISKGSVSGAADLSDLLQRVATPEQTSPSALYFGVWVSPIWSGHISLSFHFKSLTFNKGIRRVITNKNTNYVSEVNQCIFLVFKVLKSLVSVVKASVTRLTVAVVV